MTIFADASALISIIAHEDDALDLARSLNNEQHRLYSAIAAWETIAGLTHAYRFAAQQSRERVHLFLTELGFRLVPIGQHELDLALDAYARFGKGRHAARLNMGDCYAYACAKANQARLLFKGSGFGKTDIEPAMPTL